jgi:HEAT repeat protein
LLEQLQRAQDQVRNQQKQFLEQIKRAQEQQRDTIIAKLKQLDGMVRDLAGKTDAEIRKAMNDPQPETRWAASWAAGNIAAQGLRDDLIALLSDRDGYVRQAARRGLVILANRETLVWASKHEQQLRPGQLTDFGPAPLAGLQGQLAATRAWTDWWAERDASPSLARFIAGDSEIDRLCKSVTDVSEAELVPALEKLRDGPDAACTGALAVAIRRMIGNPRRLARDALVERLARLTVGALRDRLADPEPEIRRAAALASTVMESRQLVPELAKLLDDSEITVSRCAQVALRTITEQDFGPRVGATSDERSEAAAAWQKWLDKQSVR